MKTLESLFEFMPYGAPELLQSRRERLASATFLGSFAVAAAIVVAFGLAARFESQQVVVPLPPIPDFDLIPNWTAPPPLPAPPALPRPSSVEGVPVPVPDPDAPLRLEFDKTPGTQHTGPDVANGPPHEVIAPPQDEILPSDPDVYIPVDEMPQPVTVVKPEYPDIARMAGVEGQVIVKALVSKAGRVLDARLDRTRQVPMLNEAALDAARQWVFTPALTNGRPVAVWIAIPFHFRLNEAGW